MKKFIDEFTEGVALGLGLLFVIWVVATILKIFERL